MVKKSRWFPARFEEVLCAILLAVMAVITFANIISRYLLKYSFAFTEELVVSFFVWLTLLGTAIAFREQSHLGFTFIIERLSLKARKVLLWMSAALGAALFIFLIFFAIYQVGEEIALGITSSGIGVPQWWDTIGMPLWSLLVIARIFQGACRVSKKMGRPSWIRGSS